jgi:hypothetical protein
MFDAIGPDAIHLAHEVPFRKAFASFAKTFASFPQWFALRSAEESRADTH